MVVVYKSTTTTMEFVGSVFRRLHDGISRRLSIRNFASNVVKVWTSNKLTDWMSMVIGGIIFVAGYVLGTISWRRGASGLIIVLDVLSGTAGLCYVFIKGIQIFSEAHEEFIAELYKQQNQAETCQNIEAVENNYVEAQTIFNHVQESKSRSNCATGEDPKNVVHEYFEFTPDRRSTVEFEQYVSSKGPGGRYAEKDQSINAEKNSSSDSNGNTRSSHLEVHDSNYNAKVMKNHVSSSPMPDASRSLAIQSPGDQLLYDCSSSNSCVYQDTSGNSQSFGSQAMLATSNLNNSRHSQSFGSQDILPTSHLDNSRYSESFGSQDMLATSHLDISRQSQSFGSQDILATSHLDISRQSQSVGSQDILATSHLDISRQSQSVGSQDILATSHLDNSRSQSFEFQDLYSTGNSSIAIATSSESLSGGQKFLYRHISPINSANPQHYHRQERPIQSSSSESMLSSMQRDCMQYYQVPKTLSISSPYLKTPDPCRHLKPSFKERKPLPPVPPEKRPPSNSNSDVSPITVPENGQSPVPLYNLPPPRVPIPLKSRSSLPLSNRFQSPVPVSCKFVSTTTPVRSCEPLTRYKSLPVNISPGQTPAPVYYFPPRAPPPLQSRFSLPIAHHFQSPAPVSCKYQTPTTTEISCRTLTRHRSHPANILWSQPRPTLAHGSKLFTSRSSSSGSSRSSSSSPRSPLRRRRISPPNARTDTDKHTNQNPPTIPRKMRSSR